jgi:C-terminal processing protease CtpA/Prc
MRARSVCVVVFVLISLTARAVPSAQGISGNDIDTVQAMLRDAYEVVKKNYYDKSYHGVDLDARYKEYQANLKTAASLNGGVTLVAAFLDGLHDSHTYFDPPSRSYTIDYGYRLSLIGERVFITRVRPETDAAQKLNPGDEVLGVNGYAVTRDSLFSMQYYLNILSPQSNVRMQVRTITGATKDLQIEAKVTKGQRLLDLSGSGADQAFGDLIRQLEQQDYLYRQQYVEAGDTMIWKMPTFEVDKSLVDKLIGTARKHSSLVLDLRGNPGGYVDTVTRLIGGLFEQDVTMATRIRRDGPKPIMAKTRGQNAFTGKLVVLVDSGSASAAEVLARVVQLEKRGTIVGDRSAGAVMEAMTFGGGVGQDRIMLYSFSVTDADLLMKDNKSLERVGVTPDEVVLPTVADMANARDPALARAASLVGLQLDSYKAGQLFPFEWRK